jgi:predicted nucleic-acid-binding Zn-ribbon protein
MGDKIVRCPKCGRQGGEEDFLVATRQGSVGAFSVVDVGYKCPTCDEEFGFEVSAW